MITEIRKNDYRDSLIAVILPLNRCNLFNNRCNQGRNEHGRKDHFVGGGQS
jgi:hypothetical protein